MLVLTRKKSQLIQIGENIVIKVIRTGPGSVKIGIDAPSDVRVMRGELDPKLAENYKMEESESSDSDTNAVADASPECRRNERVEDEEPVSVKTVSRRTSKASAL
ncbi:carbon storage regulator [Rubinisphaera italica]|uniref:Translational regulator CsrA n=1 Tax=Rubinisphaera italica TaxID=2527969 RepID=A0A5C5XBM6_9PLAN|nr:carbon storage regulator [Rubinisphaera italica]TWT60188.1 hypothetical protein Pan54_09020 [Rubinisphaera italica]